MSPLKESPVQSACADDYKLKMQGKLVFIDGRFARNVEPSSSVKSSMDLAVCKVVMGSGRMR